MIGALSLIASPAKADAACDAEVVTLQAEIEYVLNHIGEINMKKSLLLSAVMLVTVATLSTAFAAPSNGFLKGKPFEYLNDKIELNVDDIAELEATTSQLALDIDASNLAIAELETNVVENTTMIAEIQAEIDIFDASLSATQDDVDALFSGLRALQIQHRADIRRLTASITAERREIARLRRQVQSAVVQLGRQIAEVQVAVDTNVGNIDAALVATTSNMADILAMNAILDDHESRLVSAESSLNVLVVSIDDIQVHLGNIEYRLSGVQTDVEDLQALHTTSFVGVMQNVPQSSLNGWTECFSEGFGQRGTPISTVSTACNKAKLMVACRVTGSPTLKVAAYANKSDVLTDVGTGRTATHAANGVNWYYSGDYSWGFAPGGESVSRNSCDTNNRGSNDRICSHTSSNNLQGGWRCGDATSLNSNNNYQRVFLTAD